MGSPAYLDSQNRLHRDQTSGECPHCGSVAHFSLLACPGHARLKAERPARIGIVLQCDACKAPLFFRYRIRAWLDDRIELHPQAEELEPAPERFSYAHLPEQVAGAFREALACYRAGLLQAFAAMCRTTTQAMLENLGERSRLRIFDLVAEVRMMADIDDLSFNAVRRVLFEGEPARGQTTAPLTRTQAALLLETMKDLLYQTYVRRAKFQQALRLRQFPVATAPSSAPQDESPARADGTQSARR